MRFRLAGTEASTEVLRGRAFQLIEHQGQGDINMVKEVRVSWEAGHAWDYPGFRDGFDEVDDIEPKKKSRFSRQKGRSGSDDLKPVGMRERDRKGEWKPHEKKIRSNDEKARFKGEI